MSRLLGGNQRATCHDRELFIGGIMGDILVVTSKVKKLVKEKSGFNTSSTLIDKLSDKVVQMCESAIENAKSDGRKTVMDRDFV